MSDESLELLVDVRVRHFRRECRWCSVFKVRAGLNHRSEHSEHRDGVRKDIVVAVAENNILLCNVSLEGSLDRLHLRLRLTPATLNDSVHVGDLVADVFRSQECVLSDESLDNNRLDLAVEIVEAHQSSVGRCKLIPNSLIVHVGAVAGVVTGERCRCVQDAFGLGSACSRCQGVEETKHRNVLRLNRRDVCLILRESLRSADLQNIRNERLHFGNDIVDLQLQIGQ